MGTHQQHAMAKTHQRVPQHPRRRNTRNPLIQTLQRRLNHPRQRPTRPQIRLRHPQRHHLLVLRLGIRTRSNQRRVLLQPAQLATSTQHAERAPATTQHTEQQQHQLNLNGMGLIGGVFVSPHPDWRARKSRSLRSEAWGRAHVPSCDSHRGVSASSRASVWDWGRVQKMYINT